MIPMIFIVSEVAEGQAVFFLFSSLSGVMAGFVFDIMRIIRKIFRHGIAAVWIEDFLCWVIAVFIVFYVLLTINFADIRFYNIVGAMLGAVIYFNTLGRLIIGVSDRIINFVKKQLTRLANGVKKIYAAIYKRISDFICGKIRAQKRRRQLRLQEAQKKAEKKRLARVLKQNSSLR